MHTCRLRAEGAASTQAAISEAIQHSPPHAYAAHTARLTSALDTLVAAVHSYTTGATKHSTGGTVAGSRGVSRAVSNSSSRFGRHGLGGGAGGAAFAKGCASSMLALCDGAADMLSPWTGRGGGVGGDAGWVKGVVVKLKELLLESDRWVTTQYPVVCLSCMAPSNT